MGLGAVVVLGLEMAGLLLLVLLGCCCSLRLGTEDLNDDDIAAALRSLAAPFFCKCACVVCLCSVRVGVGGVGGVGGL